MNKTKKYLICNLEKDGRSPFKNIHNIYTVCHMRNDFLQYTVGIPTILI